MAKKALVSVSTMTLTALLASALARNLTPLTQRAPQPELLGAAVHNLVLAIGIIIASWYFLTASAVLLAGALRLIGNSPARLEQVISRLGAPLLRQVVTWTAVSTVAFGAPALATPGEEMGPEAYSPAAVSDSSDAREIPVSRNSAFLVDLGWIVTAGDAIDEPDQPGVPEPAGESDPVNTAVPAREYVVQPGDTLWGIAADHLSQKSSPITDAQVAEHWPLWYSANADTIGSDPDLITPGMILRAPTLETP